MPKALTFEEIKGLMGTGVFTYEDSGYILNNEKNTVGRWKLNSHMGVNEYFFKLPAPYDEWVKCDNF